MNEGLKQEFTSSDVGDPWGTSMSWMFAICDFLVLRRGVPVPKEWGFSPSPFGVDEDSMEFKELQFLNEDGIATCDEILDFGKILWRYTRILKTQGKDY